MKEKKVKKEERKFYGYFLMDSGLKVDFDFSDHTENLLK